MSALSPGTVTDATQLPLRREPVAEAQIVSGAPSTGWSELDDGIGVWEMTPGAMRDIEADEVFIVLAGDATVTFEHPELSPIALSPGSVVRLSAGLRTVWTVRETLRKVYFDG